MRGSITSGEGVSLTLVSAVGEGRDGSELVAGEFRRLLGWGENRLGVARAVV